MFCRVHQGVQCRYYLCYQYIVIDRWEVMRRSRDKNKHSKRRTISRGAKPGGDAASLLLQAQEEHRHGREREAARFYHQSSIQIGNQPQVILTMAQQLEQRGDVESAIALLDAWVRCFDDSAMVHLC